MPQLPKQNTMEAREYMNIGEAAQYLGFAKNYVYKLTSARRIPFYKPVGRHIIFRRSELDQWVASSRYATRMELMQEGGAR